jgi:hypothetical protein
MPRFWCIIGVIVLLLSAETSTAQENSSTSYAGAIAVDFSYGYPFYVGDFNSLFGDPAPYVNIPIVNYEIYNQHSLSGSIHFPINNIFSVALRGSQTSFYYTAPDAFLHFKNSVYDVALLPTARFSFGRNSVYGYAGGGYNWHDNATLFETRNQAENEPNLDQSNSFSVSTGLGYEFRVWQQLALFIEGDLIFTGTDKIDGFNGPDLTTANGQDADQKFYFSRDKLLSARGGIRIYFKNPSRPVAERPLNDPISSYYKNPFNEPPEKEESKEDTGRQLTEREQKLGVRLKLSNYTLESYVALNLDELERQKEVAQKHLSELRTRFPGMSVYLLAEDFGYSVHFGSFSSYEKAKEARFYLRRYYSDARVLYH